MAPSDEELLEYVERIARDYAGQGLPLIAGRIIGWLLVCDPDQQSAAEIGAAIGASKASLSTNLRLLTGADVILKVTKPGDRTIYYGINISLWYAALRRRFAFLAAFPDILSDGIDLFGTDNPRSRRLAEMRELYVEVNRDLLELFERWDRRLKER